MQVSQAQGSKAQQLFSAREELEKAVGIAKELRQRERYNRIDGYDP